MMNDVGIIHMGGRIYDPVLGRFLQADPFIQAPKNSQSYNRYSYVLNNPLSYTDPSGYFFNKIFKKLNKALGNFAPLFGIALMFIPGMQAWAAQSLWHAAAVGFGIGGVSTGSLKGALIGAFSGAAFQQIGSAFNGKGGAFWDAGGAGHIGAHAVTGGIISDLSGGKFGHGFFSAGITKGLTPHFEGIGGSDFEVNGYNIAEATIAGVLGGTISQATGGKFANGAVTAAMGNLFNNQMSRKRVQTQRERLRELNKNKRRWAVQLGVVGSAKSGVGGQVETGLYVGVNANDEIEFGTYQTLSGVASTSAGWDGGLTFSYGEIFTDQLSGFSTGLFGGLDTPFVDVEWTGEAVQAGNGFPAGTIDSVSITFGPEVSIIPFVGGGGVSSITTTQRWND
jgi:RHS repeat-associated protein